MEQSDGDLGYHSTVFPEAFEGAQLGVCGVYPQSTYSDKVPRSRADCDAKAMDENLKPSIGTDGRFCVCYKPQQSYDVDVKWRAPPSSYQQWEDEWTEKQEAKLMGSDTTGSIDDVHELRQSDFKEGTYRFVDFVAFILTLDAML